MSADVKVVAVKFVKKVHELQSLLKKLEAGSEEAVDILVATMQNKDAGLKMQTECAKALLDLQIKVADTISKDSLTRQIAEIKVSGLGSNVDASGTRRLPATTNFEQIQEVK